jgi:endonuclease YncB( thermonuclease family)
MQEFTALTRLLVLVSAFLLVTQAASAATLYGKVEGVDEGDLLTVQNLNRSIKIRLLGIDAPDKQQPLAEVARQHLADLVLNKYVIVHYTGLGRDGHIVGRVVLGEMDVCAQMLRDGVAWYDTNDRNMLSLDDQQIYAATEQVARNERRGIWESSSPVAPWDFRRAAKQQLATPVATQSLASSKPVNTPARRTGLDAFSTTASAVSSNWKTLSPTDFDFSVLIPADARENGVLIPVTEGGRNYQLDFNLAFGIDGRTSYLVMWARGPKTAESDTAFINQRANDIEDLLNRQLTRAGRESLVISVARDIKNGLLRGKQYVVSLADETGVLNIYTRSRKHDRELYVLCAVNGKPSDIQVKDFLNSLTVR